MTANFGDVLNLQPGLNPWLVVLLSSIAGLLTFAASNALYVLHMRHGRLTAKFTGRSAMRVRNAIAAALIAMSVVALCLAVPGPTLVDDRGWLSGDNLFVVSSRAGFTASFPNADHEIRKGDPVLELVRDAAPEEVAAAANRRAQLAQDLQFAQLEVLRVDPLVLAAQESSQSQLDALLERRRTLVENQHSQLRGAQQDKVGERVKLDEVERDLQAARHELDQTQASFNAASASVEMVHRPDLIGVLSKEDVIKREERAAVLHSRLDELHERIALLEDQQNRLQALTSTSDETQIKHMTMRSTELEDIERQIALARTQVQAAWKAIDEDKVRAERQRDFRARQIQLEIAEYDQLLHTREGALDVRAPWDGLVGFREPSPGGAHLSNRPLLVLYKPTSISVRIHVSADEAWLASASREVGINMEALLPEAAGSAFAGKIIGGVRRPDGSAELRIVADPPEAAIRELATGSSVPVHVVIRRLNPLAAVGIGWAYWLAGALIAGCAFSETRRWWLRRPEQDIDSADTEYPLTGGLRLDWGGDPDEFLEYLVGVGIVPRKLRRSLAAVDDLEDGRGRREPPTLGAATLAQGSSPN
jgi:hypothetical protein